MHFDCNVIFGTLKHSATNASIGHIMNIMEKNNIEKALAISQKGIFFHDIDGNDHTHEICSVSKSLFPVGTIAMTKFQDVESEIAKRKSQNFKAFRIFNEYEGSYFNKPIFHKLLTILEKYDMPLIVMGGDRGSKCFISDIARVISDFNIPVIALDVHTYFISEIIDTANDVDNLYFSSRLFTVLGSLEKLCSEIGAHKLLLGTGMPYCYTGQSTYVLEKARISEFEKKAISNENLRKLFKL